MTESFEEYYHFFEVKLEQFSGPIDLLLHLVKQNELPIEKISLAQVASQYFQCIETMRYFDLEIAGEYLVIATTLLSIKSSILLNQPVELIQDEDGNLIDPQEELLRRLREAEVYRECAATLGSRDLLDMNVFSSPSSLGLFEEKAVTYIDHSPMILGKALKKLLEKAIEIDPYTVLFDPVTIVERMAGVLEVLKERGGRLAFEQVIPELYNRGTIIGCFLAVLELCKRGIVRVEQVENFNNIYVVLADETPLALELSSEFDEVAT